MNFSTVPSHLDEIFRWIARVPAGQSALSRFIPLYRSRKVLLAPYPQELLVRLRAALGEGQYVGACFFNDGDSGTIHYDSGAPLGVLAPFLVHEMAHAADARLWSAARLPQAPEERERGLLEAEARAFDLQYQFVQELRLAEPEFAFFLESQQERVRILTERMSTEAIADLYGFKRPA